MSWDLNCSQKSWKQGALLGFPRVLFNCVHRALLDEQTEGERGTGNSKLELHWKYALRRCIQKRTHVSSIARNWFRARSKGAPTVPGDIGFWPACVNTQACIKGCVLNSSAVYICIYIYFIKKNISGAQGHCCMPCLWCGWEAGAALTVCSSNQASLLPMKNNKETLL